MIVKPAETYRRVAEKYGVAKELVISIADAVFSDLMEKMLVPKALAYELDHVGTFAIRHKNFVKKHGKQTEGSQFTKNWESVPQLIEDFRTKRDNFKLVKHGWETKTRKES